MNAAIYFNAVNIYLNYLIFDDNIQNIYAIILVSYGSAPSVCQKCGMGLKEKIITEWVNEEIQLDEWAVCIIRRDLIIG